LISLSRLLIQIIKDTRFHQVEFFLLTLKEISLSQVLILELLLSILNRLLILKLLGSKMDLLFFRVMTNKLSSVITILKSELKLTAITFMESAKDSSNLSEREMVNGLFSIVIVVRSLIEELGFKLMDIIPSIYSEKETTSSTSTILEAPMQWTS